MAKDLNNTSQVPRRNIQTGDHALVAGAGGAAMVNIDSIGAAADARIEELRGWIAGRDTYTTLALATAAGETTASVEVLNDPDADNNGLWIWDGGTLVKSPYDLTQLIKSLNYHAGFTYEILVDDIVGDGLEAAVAGNSIGAGVISPTGWPSGVEKVFEVVASDDANTTTVDFRIRTDDNGFIMLDDYLGKYVNVRYLARFNGLTPDASFYRTGLLFVADGGVYPKLDAVEYQRLSTDIVLMSGTAFVDDLIGSKTNMKIWGVQPQVKPNVAGSFEIGAIQVGFFDSENESLIGHQYEIKRLVSNSISGRIAGLESKAEAAELSAAQASATASLALANSGAANLHIARLKKSIFLNSESVDVTTATVTASATKALTSNVIEDTDERLTFLHGKIVQPAGLTYPKTLGTRIRSHTQTAVMTDHSGNSTAFGVEFEIYADAFEIGYLGVPLERYVQIEVDGVALDESGHLLHDETTGLEYLLVQFSDRKHRRIRITAPDMVLTSINLPIDGALYRHEPKVACSLVVAGDSFTEGSAASRTWRKFAIKLGRLMGIQNTVASGLGGTGYLKTITNYDGNERLNLLERVGDLYNPFGDDTRPDGIVFCMGINDSGLVVSDVAAAARSTFDAIRAVTTEVPLFVVGPWQANKTYYTELANALKAEAEATQNAYYIDNTGWITGTGNVDNVVGNGIADWTQSADQTHPSDEGHDYLAHRLSAALRGVIREI